MDNRFYGLSCDGYRLRRNCFFMEKFEALWAYQVEDMKADAISAAIKRSPTRQKLEKARDFILDRQKQYKQIEEDVGAMVDRKDIIAL